jgi:hypothetical protein
MFQLIADQMEGKAPRERTSSPFSRFAPNRVTRALQYPNLNRPLLGLGLA